jgi:hypothetical protein
MKSSFFHFIIALAVAVAVLVGYSAWYAVVAKESASVANLQNQIVVKTEAASGVASARTAIAKVASDEAEVQNYFVPETGVVAFINNLEALGQAQGTTVRVLSVSADAGAQPAFLFSLTVKGTFDAVLRTVGAIEYAPYDLSVSSFSFEQDAKNSWHANLGLVVGSTDSETATSTP